MCYFHSSHFQALTIFSETSLNMPVPNLWCISTHTCLLLNLYNFLTVTVSFGTGFHRSDLFTALRTIHYIYFVSVSYFFFFFGDYQTKMN